MDADLGQKKRVFFNYLHACLCSTLTLPVDGTLPLLVNSAQYRGLPHDLTKNLAWLFKSHRVWTSKLYYAHKQRWKPNLPADSPEYLPPRKQATSAKILRQEEVDKVKFDAWGALGEVVEMAEGQCGLSLGRMTYPKNHR